MFRPWCSPCFTWHASGKHVPPMPPETLDPGMCTTTGIAELTDHHPTAISAACDRLGVGFKWMKNRATTFTLLTRDEAALVLHELETYVPKQPVPIAR